LIKRKTSVAATAVRLLPSTNGWFFIKERIKAAALSQISG